MAVVVKLLQGLVNPTQTWEPGQLFECANAEYAQDMINAGIAASVDGEPIEAKEEKPKPKKKG